MTSSVQVETRCPFCSDVLVIPVEFHVGDYLSGVDSELRGTHDERGVELLVEAHATVCPA